MKILVTGAKGFIGKNLTAELRSRKNDDVLGYDMDSDPSLLDAYCKEAGYVFHLAGVNRPTEQNGFMEGNHNFTAVLLDALRRHGNTCPVMISSSIQAALDNPYGRSKKAAEELMLQYAGETGARVLIYRLPNVFGKWCRPNYNSAVATFCSNIAHGLPIVIKDRGTALSLVYIDDLLEELVNALEGRECSGGLFCEVPVVYSRTLGEIADLIYSFRDSREERTVPDMSDGFIKKLYSTYLSYLPEDRFAYPLNMNTDGRGSFTEFLKTRERGQVSINISKPGVVKGNHWHHSKNEKFLVVSGEGIIRFRKIDSADVTEYRVSGERLQVVDVPAGYTHNIENCGAADMVTVMWASESFNPEKPDTYYMEV